MISVTHFEESELCKGTERPVVAESEDLTLLCFKCFSELVSSFSLLDCSFYLGHLVFGKLPGSMQPFAGITVGEEAGTAVPEVD